MPRDYLTRDLDLVDTIGQQLNAMGTYPRRRSFEFLQRLFKPNVFLETSFQTASFCVWVSVRSNDKLKKNCFGFKFTNLLILKKMKSRAKTQT